MQAAEELRSRAAQERRTQEFKDVIDTTEDFDGNDEDGEIGMISHQMQKTTATQAASIKKEKKRRQKRKTKRKRMETNWRIQSCNLVLLLRSVRQQKSKKSKHVSVV